MLHFHPLMKLEFDEIKETEKCIFFSPMVPSNPVCLFLCVSASLHKPQDFGHKRMSVLCLLPASGFIVFRLCSFRKPSWAQARR